MRQECNGEGGIRSTHFAQLVWHTVFTTQPLKRQALNVSGCYRISSAHSGHFDLKQVQNKHKRCSRTTRIRRARCIANVNAILADPATFGADAANADAGSWRQACPAFLRSCPLHQRSRSPPLVHRAERFGWSFQKRLKLGRRRGQSITPLSAGI